MGCCFSRKQALCFKKRRKSQIPKSYEEQNLYVPSYGTKVTEKPANHVMPSKGADTIQACLFENILQEYSTLGFLMAGKNFPDQELVFSDAKPPSFNAIPAQEAVPQTTTVPIRARASLSHEDLSAKPDEISHPSAGIPYDLPDCVTYEGFHECGFHLIRVDSEKYSGSVENSDTIPDCISSIIGGDKCVVVFKQLHGDTAYLPDQSSYDQDLFDYLSARLGEQLLHIVFHNPSWYVEVCLDLQSRTGSHFFSQATMEKLRFTKDDRELAKLTGFPGQIKSS